jgi:hypothetical protein
MGIAGWRRIQFPPGTGGVWVGNQKKAFLHLPDEKRLLLQHPEILDHPAHKYSIPKTHPTSFARQPVSKRGSWSSSSLTFGGFY